MKMRSFIAFLIVCSVSCKPIYVFTSFREPANEGLRLLYSKDGLHWKGGNRIFLKPAVGEQQVMRDPSIVQGPDGVFHLVWTSSWRGDNGFGYATSKDLVHWSEQSFIPVMKQEPTVVNVWAPELFYDAPSDSFAIVWASCIPGKFARGIEADSNNHRLYWTTTRNFKEFAPTRIFFDPGYSVIDGTLTRNKEGKYVLVYKDNTRPERLLKTAFSDVLAGPYEPVEQPFSDHFTEGPTILSLKNEWLVYYDAYQKKIYEAASTIDFRNFTNATERIKLPEGHKHGTIFKASGKLAKNIIEDN